MQNLIIINFSYFTIEKGKNTNSHAGEQKIKILTMKINRIFFTVLSIVFFVDIKKVEIVLNVKPENFECVNIQRLFKLRYIISYFNKI